MAKKDIDIIEGVFLNIRVIITQKKVIRIFNDKSVPFYDFKPMCDRIGRYLVDEGFVNTKTPRIEVKTP